MKSILGLALSLIFAGQVAAPTAPHTWYVRADGGTRSQCSGLADAAYPGSGSAQPCALGDYRSLYDGGVYAQLKWIIAGGDTVILDNTKQWRVGFDQSSPSDPWCPGGGANPWGCFNPPIPAGTASQHTRILGRNYASCADRSQETQIFGGHGIWAVLNLDATSYVDVECIEVTSHSTCIVHGQPNPAPCQTSYPVDDYDSDGIITDTGTHNILLQDMWIHGHTDRGIKGPIGGIVTANRVDISTNGMAGWDFDDGNATASVNATLNLLYTTIEWSGCNQVWPSPLPAFCYDDQSGGYGDGIGTPPGMAMNVNMDHAVFRYNTQDGPDFGHITNPSTMTVANSQSYGNMGGAFKWGEGFNKVSFTNNLMIANCNRMQESIPGIPATFNAHLGDFCRAGDAISFNVVDGATVALTRSTLVTAAPTAYDVACKDPVSCAAAAISFTKNITLGLKSAHQTYNGNAGPGGFCGAGCNASPLPIGALNRSGNIFFGLGNCPANAPEMGAGGTATGESCVDPLFVGEPAGDVPESMLDGFNPLLVAGSPATGLGYTPTDAPAAPQPPPTPPPTPTPTPALPTPPSPVPCESVTWTWADGSTETVNRCPKQQDALQE